MMYVDFKFKVLNNIVKNKCQQFNFYLFQISDESTTLSTKVDNDTITLPSDHDTIKELKKKLDEANKKLEKANIIICNNEKRKIIFLKRLRQLKNSIKLRSDHDISLANLLHEVFYKDQLEYLKAKYKGHRIYKWTDETIKKALRLKHACGDNGYTELLRQHIPLPSTRTLRRHLECIAFKDGICDEIFDLLKDKVSNFPDERHKDCMICVDEMSIIPGEQIDPCTKHTIGYATISNKFGKFLV